MKIAVCLSGQPRYLDDGFNQIYDKIIFKYPDVDFFVHTWWSDEMANKKMELSTKLTYGRNYTWDKDTISKINHYYNPKLMLYEPQREFNIYTDVNYELCSPISPYSMFYSIRESNKLKYKWESDNRIKYDLVIRCRFDIEFIKFDIDLNNIDSKKIYTYSQNGFPNDQFAISSSENMDYYSSLYDNLELYHNEGFKGFIGERLLKYHLDKTNIQVEYDKFINSIILKK